MKCATFELPFRNDEQFGVEGRRDEVDLQAVLSVLAEEGFVHQADGQWNWTNESYPADAVSLRSVSSDNFVVVDCTNGTRDRRDRFHERTRDAPRESHLHSRGSVVPGGAVRLRRRKAYLRAVDCDYYTDAITIRGDDLDTFESGSGTRDAGSEELATNCRVRGSRIRVPPFDRLRASELVEGRIRRQEKPRGIHVVSRVVGFKKIKFYTNENVGSGELDLPEQQMHTSSYWLTIPANMMSSLPFAGDDRRDGVVGLAFAMKNIAQLLLMCDGHDIGLSVDGGSLDRTTRTGGVGGVPEALATDPNIFIYDNYPGGIGFSRPLFEMHALLLERTRELIAGCPCTSGCPSCVGPEGNTGPHAKQVASRILDRLLEAEAL